MKKNYALLAAVCMLTACSDSEAASETAAIAETSDVTEITTALETTTSSETTSITEAATDISQNYTYNFAERLGGTSDEQNRLYEFFEENSDSTEIFKNIDDSRAQMSQNEKLSSAIPENYDIYAHEFFADFDGDGNGELYVCRTANLYPQSPWGIYQELWYTDGESCVTVDSSIGRGLFAGILEPLDGVPLMYIVPEIAMGSAVQLPDVYIIKDGKPALYELPEGERFLYDGFKVFISLDGGGSEGYQRLLDALDEAEDDPDSFQTLGWVDGELKIISGYAAETAKTAVSADYTLNYKRYGNPSEEQDRLYEFLSENWNCDELIKEIDLFRVRMSELSDDYSLPDEYTVYADEYFADFDGDGSGELYVCRNTGFYSEVPLAEYRELWYTDGESCIKVYSSGGHDMLCGGICEPQGGIPLMYVVPEVYTSSAFQSADVYYIRDGKPTLYELPKSEYFLCGGKKLFIKTCNESEYKEFADALDKTRDDPDSFQTIGWVDGELKIISGYGENGAEDT